VRAFRLPPLRRRAWRTAAVAAAALAAAGGAGMLRLPAASPALAGLTGLALVLLAAVVWLLDRRVLRPLTAVTRGAEILARSSPGHRLEVRGRHWLEGLPERLQELGDALGRSQAELEEAVAAWSSELEERKARLETVLREIREGVVVCDGGGRLLLYNDAARALLHGEPALGLGRRVGEILNDAPLCHTLDLLRQRREGSESVGNDGAELVCATASGDRLLRCRLTLLPEDGPEAGGFVLTLEDVSTRTRALLRRERALRQEVESLRDPLASLRAASESLAVARAEGLDSDVARFSAVIDAESARLGERFARLCAETESVVTDNWRLEDVHAGDLLVSVMRRRRRALPRAQVRADVWARAEPYLVSQVLETLLGRLRAEHDVAALVVIAREEGSRVYLDMVWSGRAVPSGRLAVWLDAPLEDVGGTVSAREVLERHDTAVWSFRDPDREGRALLRLPLPAAPAKVEPGRSLPPRPEFYDFSLSERARPLGERAERPLDELDYVVFDTETTGLEPSHGDEIVAIGAVRVTAGRVIHGETFETLVDPGRDIPELATRVHGLSTEDVAGAPKVDEALRRFKGFVGDAVLVGHNVAFDMRFLKLRQRSSGVRFDNPALDSLLLSILIHDHTPEHTLEAIAQRLGVAVGARHTALGDALTTAEIFVRLLDLLPGQGIVTLRDAVAASERMVEYRRQQRAF